VSMTYDAFTQSLTCSWTTNGVPVGSVHTLRLDDPISSQFGRDDDYRVNIFSISSYKSNEGLYANSVLAHGVIDNISVTIPPAPPVTRLQGSFAEQRWQMMFRSRADWNYALERTRDFLSWETVTATVPGNGGDLLLADPAELADKAFYRVRATQ
jgi:hypothetical protein